MMLPGCARSCGGASVFYWCWRLEHAARRPNLARTAAVDRTPAEQAEQPEVADVEEAAARRDPWADRAEVAAPAAARRIRSGVQVASPAPACATPAAVPASRVLRRMAERARLDRAARPAAEAPAVAAARRARAAEVATAAARADAVDPEGAPDAAEREAARAARVEQQCAARARARAASFACAPAVAARLRAAIRSPMAANVRRGWTYRAFCNTSPTPGPGCEEPPCTPPAPFCITRPASCGATVTCACLPANVCQTGGGCGLISGGEVICQSA